MSNQGQTMQLDDVRTQQYSDQAKARLLQLQEAAQQVAQEHPELADQARLVAETTRDSDLYEVSSTAYFTGLLVWEQVTVNCAGSHPVKCTANCWGPTVAVGGISYGTSWFTVPPQNLHSYGELTMQVYIASVFVEITWWKNGTLIGTYVGGGVGIGAALVGGTTTFQPGK